MVRHVVIGGGIAGVCCVEELCRLRPADAVTLISSSTVLKVCVRVCVCVCWWRLGRLPVCRHHRHLVGGCPLT
jgi:hypothetical protein